MLMNARKPLHSIAFWLVLGATTASCQTFSSARPLQKATTQTPPIVLKRIVDSIKAAKAFEYSAIVTMANIDDSGQIGEPHVFTVECREQEPNGMRLNIRQGKEVVAILASGKDGGTYYDARSNKYFAFETLQSDADWRALHKKIDGITGNSDIGSLFDTTLIHKPMLDIAEQSHRDGPVNYTAAKSVINGKNGIRVSQQTSVGGNAMFEDVSFDSNHNLLAYAVSFEHEGQRILGQRQFFNSLKFLSSQLPEADFVYTPPADASQF